MKITMTLEQAAAACDAAFITYSTIMSAKRQSTMSNPCFGASTPVLVIAGFEQGTTVALAELARRAKKVKNGVRVHVNTASFLAGKLKWILQKADRAESEFNQIDVPVVAKQTPVATPIANKNGNGVAGMDQKKLVFVRNEGDMEAAILNVVDLALSSGLVKVINIWFPTDGMSDIFLENCFTEFALRNIKCSGGNMEMNLFIS